MTENRTLDLKVETLRVHGHVDVVMAWVKQFRVLMVWIEPAVDRETNFNSYSIPPWAPIPDLRFYMQTVYTADMAEVQNWLRRMVTNG